MTLIEEVYMFVMGSETVYDECLMMMFDKETKEWHPMITTSEEDKEKMTEIANQISNMTGKPYRIKKFKMVGITREGEMIH